VTDPQELLRDLVAAERDAPPDLEAEARNWAAIERRMIQGPGPPDLPEPGTAALIKWIGGLALVGGLVAGGVLLGAGRGEAPAAARTGLAAETGAAADHNLAEETGPAVDHRLAEETGPVVDHRLAEETGPVADQELPEETGVAPALESAEEIGAAGHKLSEATGDAPTRADKPRPRKPAPRPDAAAPAEPLDLAAELRLLASIRAALRRGDSEAALAGVAEHRRSFGAAGALVQERSAHEVEALCAAGREADARRLAAEFLRSYPDSPHRARVTSGCAEK